MLELSRCLMTLRFHELVLVRMNDKWDKTKTHDELNSWRKSFEASSVKIAHEEDMTWL